MIDLSAHPSRSVCLVCPVCQSFSQSVNSFSCVRTAWPSCPQQQQQQQRQPEKYAITAIRDSNLSFHRVELFCFASFSFRFSRLYFRALFNLSLPLEARCLLPLAARRSVLPVACQRRQFHHLLIPIPIPSFIPSPSPSLGQSPAESRVLDLCFVPVFYLRLYIKHRQRHLEWDSPSFRDPFLRSSSSSRFSRRFLFRAWESKDLSWTWYPKRGGSLTLGLPQLVYCVIGMRIFCVVRRRG